MVLNEMVTMIPLITSHRLDTSTLKLMELIIGSNNYRLLITGYGTKTHINFARLVQRLEHTTDNRVIIVRFYY